MAEITNDPEGSLPTVGSLIDANDQRYNLIERAEANFNESMDNLFGMISSPVNKLEALTDPNNPDAVKEKLKDVLLAKKRWFESGGEFLDELTLDRVERSLSVLDNKTGNNEDVIMVINVANDFSRTYAHTIVHAQYPRESAPSDNSIKSKDNKRNEVNLMQGKIDKLIFMDQIEHVFQIQNTIISNASSWISSSE